MEKIRDFFKANIFSSILFLILGIILVIKPDTVISVIAYTIAFILLVIGVNAIIKYIQDNNQKFNFFGGIISITGAVFLFFRYETVVSLIPFIVGLYIVISNALRIEYIINLKKDDNKKYINMLVTVIIGFICGLFLVFNPFSSTLTITRIIGIFMIIHSIVDMYQTNLIKKEVKKIEKIIIEETK